MKQNTHREVDLFDRAMKENYIDFVGDFTCKDLKVISIFNFHF